MIRSLASLGCFKLLRTNIGQDTFVDKSVRFIGLKNIKIGSHTVIGEDTLFNVNSRGDDEWKIIIGTNCFIGKRNFFSSGLGIYIGDYCLISHDCKFNGSFHLFDDPFVPFVQAATNDCDKILIGANCFFGTGAVVSGNVTVGYGSIIGSGSLICKNVPPLSVVVGNPGKVIKRYNVRLNKWEKIEDYHRDNDDFLLSEKEYIKLLKNKFPVIDKPLHAASQKFGHLK